METAGEAATRATGEAATQPAGEAAESMGAGQRAVRFFGGGGGRFRYGVRGSDQLRVGMVSEPTGGRTQ